MKKELEGRGPLSVVLSPRREVPELAAFEIEAHGARCRDCDDDAPLAWTATRGAGIMVESITLTASVTHADLDALPPTKEIAWTVTASVVPAPERLGGVMAALSALAAVAVAFTVPVRAAHLLPATPELYFAVGSIVFVISAAATAAVAYWLLREGARALGRRMQARPPPAVEARLHHLETLAMEIARLGIREV